jgi:hypothetical protein
MSCAVAGRHGRLDRSFAAARLLPTVALAVSIAALVAVGRACAQESPKPDAPKGEHADPGRPDKPKAEPVHNDVVECHTLGATYATLDFGEAEAGADGRRTQFEKLPADVAFECWLDGFARKVTLQEPDPDKPGATRPVAKNCVAVLRVKNDEWDQYYNFLRKDTPPPHGPGDESVFLNVLLNAVLEQKTQLLWRRDLLPEVEKRANDAVDLLRKNHPFKDVVRALSEDDTTRQADGLFADDTRGSALDRYPLSKVFFDLGPNQIAGPIYTKNAAYVIHVDHTDASRTPWIDHVKASAVVLRFTTGRPATPEQIQRSKSALRVRTELDRFRRILPPTIQVPPPKQFGPDDVAPVGKPDTPLKVRHVEDAKDDKVGG